MLFSSKKALLLNFYSVGVRTQLSGLFVRVLFSTFGPSVDGLFPLTQKFYFKSPISEKAVSITNMYIFEIYFHKNRNNNAY
jgi:hypothetical protein